MAIYNFDADEWLDEIDLHYQNVKKIKDSRADNSDKYRRFSNEINIEFNALDQCCNCFEWSLLINCYTFAEQLSKTLFYTLIGKDRHGNMYINNFINKKVSEEKFSPNVKFQEIENLIREVYPEFKFILSKKRREIILYDEMIQARHRYAHRGNYMFDFKNFNDVIKVLYYIKFELRMVSRFRAERTSFQNDFREIFVDINAVYKKICQKQEQKRMPTPSLREIKLNCKNIIKKYDHFFNYSRHQNSLLDELFSMLKNISQMDLRSYSRCAPLITNVYNYLNE